MVPFATDNEIHQQLIFLLNEGHRCGLITIMHSSGSVPRLAGTKAIVDSAGTLYGTIGGGWLEAKAKMLAPQCLASGKATVFDFQFSGTNAQDNDPICGGHMRILIDPQVKADLPLYVRIANALESHKRGVLVTVLSKRTHQTESLWLLSNQHLSINDETVSGAVQSAFSSHTPIYFSSPDGESEGLAQLLKPTPILLIAGGGHVGQALAWQGSFIGFRVAVYDDRPEFCEASRYPENTILRSGAVEEFFDEFPLTQDTFICLVGRNHQVDMRALKLCLHKSVAYIGMMGSRRKVELLRRELDEVAFDSIHAPIGLNIGAQTVPEIAASIAAELIAVRRGGPFTL